MTEAQLVMICKAITGFFLVIMPGVMILGALLWLEIAILKEIICAIAEWIGDHVRDLRKRMNH